MRKGEFNLLGLRSMLPVLETELSVKETATELILLLDNLSKFDPIFSAFVPQKRKKTRIDLSAFGIEGAVEDLTKYFLDSTNWTQNVPTWDVTPNPTEDSKLSTGFQFNFAFDEAGENRFHLTGNISHTSKHFPRIVHLQYFNTKTDFNYSFGWYENLLKAYVQYWQPLEASIIYLGSEWLNMNVKTGIGRVTYFSHHFDEFEIPNNLSGVEYVHQDNGRYLYVCPECIPEKEAFLAHEAKTVRVMKELLSRVPEYQKPPRQS